MPQVDNILNRDELLDFAEALERQLRSDLQAALGNRFRRDDPHSLGGELRKVIRFYEYCIRFQESNPEQKVGQLLSQNVPNRGKTPQYWRVIRSQLSTQRLSQWKQRYDIRGVIFLLSWTARLLY
jgi:hypothetical protein